MRGLILGRSRRRIVKDFVAARATSADRAIPYVANDARIFRQLRVYGAIVDDGAGRYHLDARKLGAFRASVRLRAAAIVGVSGVAASVAAAATVFALAE
ncbi:hypothetical protein IFT67_04655 [Sphingomonas sp. CFBP 13728]|uniref:hypothetical protein n=1 Tax=unclassified Sphingomonas TaxID=196159 RepID=UPI000EF91B6A|nr:MULTISPECIES: hypothetical protein [unclassified Sphingomonas]MBD8618205.1 hypothetical protein [Sphingomonas sp. CFBP 13728]MBE2990661.1 hypothetical protein [Sphingomonas sp. CFBP 13603]TCP71446.1 hypothetical protein C8J43_102525 [Sphingomonas sp. PP-CE-1G-424]